MLREAAPLAPFYQVAPLNLPCQEGVRNTENKTDHPGGIGLTIAPNGHILTINSGDGNIVETAPSGLQAATMTLDSADSPPGAGALFGLAVAPGASGVYYVDDAANTLNLLH